MNSDKSAANNKLRHVSGSRIAIPILGIIGMSLSSYLVYIHYNEISPLCLNTTHCNAVLASPYAQIWGIPLALFGLLVYAVLTVMGFLLLSKKMVRQDLVALGIYAIALSGTLFTIYLYYLEIFEIHAFCMWCIASSLILFSLFGMSLVNLKSVGINRKVFRRCLEASD
jgi:uncharacterized membrane protein